MSSLPRLPFVSLDMDSCRDPVVVGQLIKGFDEHGIGIAFPGVATWELCKGSPNTVEHSMRLLQARPEAVNMALPSIVVMHYEKERRALVDVIDHDRTANLRYVLRSLQAGLAVDPSSVQEIRKHWEPVVDAQGHAEIIRKLAKNHLDRAKDDPKQWAEFMEIRKALCRGDDAPFRSALSEMFADKTKLADYLVGIGYDADVARDLVDFPSYSILELFAIEACSLRRMLLTGDLARTKDTTLEHDIPDAEYAILAAYGLGYAVKDGLARKIHEDVVYVSDGLWP